MKLLRNMSIEELSLFMDGYTIKGRNQRKYNSSVEEGVCFFPYDNESCRRQVNTWHWDIVAIIEIDDDLLTPQHGTYPNWDSPCWEDTVILPEYSIKEYSLENARLIGYYYREFPNQIFAR